MNTKLFTNLSDLQSFVDKTREKYYIEIVNIFEQKTNGVTAWMLVYK